MKVLKNRIVYIVLFVVLYMFGCIFIQKLIPQMSLFGKEQIICGNTEVEMELKNNVTVYQTFIMPYDRISEIKIYFRKGEGNSQGKVFIDLLDEQDESVFTWKMREDLLPDDGFQTFKIGKSIPVSKNQKYGICVKSIENDEVSANICISNSNIYENGQIVIDGEVEEGDLAFGIVGTNSWENQKIFLFLILALFLAIFIFCIYYVITKPDHGMMLFVEPIDWGLFFVIAISCALLFSQYNDLELTIKHSEDLISVIKQGDFLKFYDIVLEKALDGGYGRASFLDAANYNIILYLILSIIIFPWVFVRKVFSIQYDYFWIVIYVQCFLIVFDIIAANILRKVCVAFGQTKQQANIVSYLFLSSTITLFATVGFGQLDIIYIIIMLLSILFYAKEQYYRFSIVMSVAIMLKMFPLMLFIPLVLLVNKKIWKILVNLVFGLSSSAVFSVFFSGNYGYSVTKEKMDGYYNFLGRMVNCRVDTGLIQTSLFIVAFVLLCIWAYYQKVESNQELYSKLVLSGLVAYGTFAVLVLWHPQWLVILSVFIAMAIPLFENKRIALFCDLAIQILYLVVTNIYYIGSVDNYMINNGVLAKLTNHSYSGIAFGQIVGKVANLNVMIFSAFAGGLIGFVFLFSKQFKRLDPTQYMNNACERIIVWSRVAIMYFYCFIICLLFFCF